MIVANDGASGRADAFWGDLAEPATVPAVAVGRVAGEQPRSEWQTVPVRRRQA